MYCCCCAGVFRNVSVRYPLVLKPVVDAIEGAQLDVYLLACANLEDQLVGDDALFHMDLLRMALLEYALAVLPQASRAAYIAPLAPYWSLSNDFALDTYLREAIVRSPIAQVAADLVFEGHFFLAEALLNLKIDDVDRMLWVSIGLRQDPTSVAAKMRWLIREAHGGVCELRLVRPYFFACANGQCSTVEAKAAMNVAKSFANGPLMYLLHTQFGVTVDIAPEDAVVNTAVLTQYLHQFDDAPCLTFVLTHVPTLTLAPPRTMIEKLTMHHSGYVNLSFMTSLIAHRCVRCFRAMLRFETPYTQSNLANLINIAINQSCGKVPLADFLCLVEESITGRPTGTAEIDVDAYLTFDVMNQMPSAYHHLWNRQWVNGLLDNAMDRSDSFLCVLTIMQFTTTPYCLGEAWGTFLQKHFHHMEKYIDHPRVRLLLQKHLPVSRINSPSFCAWVKRVYSRFGFPVPKKLPMSFRLAPKELVDEDGQCRDCVVCFGKADTRLCCAKETKHFACLSCIDEWFRMHPGKNGVMGSCMVCRRSVKRLNTLATNDHVEEKVVIKRQRTV